MKKEKKTILALILSLLLIQGSVLSVYADSEDKHQAPEAVQETVKVSLHLLQDGYTNPHDYQVDTLNVTKEALPENIPSATNRLIESTTTSGKKVSMADYIASQMRKHNKEVDLVSYNLTYTNSATREKALLKVYKATVDAINHNPELFFLDSTFSVKYGTAYDSQGQPVGGMIYSALPTYSMSQKKAAAERKVFDKTVKKCLKTVRGTMNAAQKAKAVHDFLALNAEYDYANYYAGTIPLSSYRANGVLVKKKGVCQSYAMAYKYIMEKKLKIKCTYAYTDSHLWNLVRVGHKNYNVDVTWDDGGKKKVHHTYFLVSKNKMKKAHPGKRLSFDVSPASKKYSHSSKPARNTIKKIIGDKSSTTVHWKEYNASHGYEIFLSSKKNSGFEKIKTFKKYKYTKYTKKNLETKKTYYFKVRSYKLVKGKKKYGAFSSVKSISTE